MIGRRGALAVVLAGIAGPGRAEVAEPEGYRMDDYRQPVPRTVQGGVVLHVADVRALLDQGSVVLVDVLPAPRRPSESRPGTPWLPVPHRDVPGSLWWPDVGRGGITPEVEARFEGRVRALAAAHPGGRVVFYCLDQCWMSWNAAKRAAGYGVPVGWFPEGMDGWMAAGLPTQEVKPDFLE